MRMAKAKMHVFMLALLAVVFPSLAFSLFSSSKESTFVQPKHAPGVTVADFARHDLPKLRMGERTNDLTSGVHFVSSCLGAARNDVE